YDMYWFCLFSESQMFSLPSFQKRRRRIDRSMIGEPTNFVHTAHVGSGDLFSGMNSVS
ncbi:C4S2A protein, partial [Peucedramus taeniatus]|nr:C4S2A protein [Peucedramus taeniatus]